MFSIEELSAIGMHIIVAAKKGRMTFKPRDMSRDVLSETALCLFRVAAQRRPASKPVALSRTAFSSPHQLSVGDTSTVSGRGKVMKRPLRILLVDNHRMVVEGLKVVCL
jgi:hypothetical protein